MHAKRSAIANRFGGHRPPLQHRSRRRNGNRFTGGTNGHKLRESTYDRRAGFDSVAARVGFWIYLVVRGTPDEPVSDRSRRRAFGGGLRGLVSRSLPSTT